MTPLLNLHSPRRLGSTDPAARYEAPGGLGSGRRPVHFFSENIDTGGRMADETRPLRVMPGDKIEWEVEISSQSRIHMVYAYFFKETEDPSPRQLALGGEVYTFEKAGERRTNHAVLRSEGHANLPEVEAGDYRLSSMSCITSSAATLNIAPETLPSHIIRIEREPDDEIPRLGESRLRVR